MSILGNFFAVPTTPPPTTTPEECSEDLDFYEPVTVTRLNSDTGSSLLPQDWWSPESPPGNVDFPHEGSFLEVHFAPRSRVTSVIINSISGATVAVLIAFKFQPSETSGFFPLKDETNSPIFTGFTGSKTHLSPSTPFVARLKVYIVSPVSSTEYQVIFNGCEEEGEILKDLMD